MSPGLMIYEKVTFVLLPTWWYDDDDDDVDAPWHSISLEKKENSFWKSTFYWQS